jgi:hypothetical protein
MREYGEVHHRFWIHPDIQDMDDGSKLLAAYLLTGPHSNALGCYRLPDGYVIADLQWSKETVAKRFDNLCRIGFAVRDEGSGFVFVRRFLRWNRIQNTNVGKHVAKLLELVPENVSFGADLCDAVKRFGQHLPNGIETVLKRFRIPEPEPEPEPEPIPFLTERCRTAFDASPGEQAEASDDAGDEPPAAVNGSGPGAILEAWNTAAEKLPKARGLSPKREKHARQRLKEHPLEWWSAVFLRMNETPFLCGENDRGWVATFDWAISSPDNTLKVDEGKYDRAGRKPQEVRRGTGGTAGRDPWAADDCENDYNSVFERDARR